MKIVITGTCAEGKTTLALLIEETLRKAGFEVTNSDIDVHHGMHYPKLQDKRITALTDPDRGLKIEIETVQVAREKR